VVPPGVCAAAGVAARVWGLYGGRGGADGIFYGGGATLLGKQAIGVVAVLAYSMIIAFILGFAIDKTIGFRISRDSELEGIDVTEHLESAYDLDSRGGASGGGILASAAHASPKNTATEA
jgi:Amt family ammonium transporter